MFNTFYKGEAVGTWMDYGENEIIKLEDDRMFALNGWNGEKWFDCWQVDDRFTAMNDEKINITPVYQLNDNDEDEIFAYIVE